MLVALHPVASVPFTQFVTQLLYFKDQISHCCVKDWETIKSSCLSSKSQMPSYPTHLVKIASVA